MSQVKYLLLFSLLPFLLYCQTEELKWIKEFDTNEGCGVEKVLISDSGVYVALQFQGSLEIEDTILHSKGLFDLALLSYDIDGNLQWALQAGSNNTDNTTDLEISADGRMLWTGLFWDELSLADEKYIVSIRSRAIFVASINMENGEVIWCNLIQGEGSKESQSISSDLAGNVLVAGFFNVSLFADTLGVQSNSDNAAFFIVFDSNGKLVRHFVSQGTGSAKIHAAQLSADRIYVTGTFKGSVMFNSESLSGPLIDTDIFLAAFDRSAGLIWLSTATGILDDNVIDLLLTNDEKLMLAGNFSGRLLFGPGLELQSMGFATDIFTAFYDLNGIAQSIFNISNPGNDELMSIRNTDMGWILCGTFDQEFLWEGQVNETPTGSRSGFVLHLDNELKNTLAINLALSDGFLGRSGTDSRGEMITAGFSIPAFTSFIGQEFYGSGIYKGVLIVYKSKPNSIPQSGPAQTAFRVYPNPASNKLYIESGDMDYVILYSLSGSIIGSWSKADILLPDLNNGHYLLTIVMKNGLRQSVLIQINH